MLGIHYMAEPVNLRYVIVAQHIFDMAVTMCYTGKIIHIYLSHLKSQMTKSCIQKPKYQHVSTIFCNHVRLQIKSFHLIRLLVPSPNLHLQVLSPRIQLTPFVALFVHVGFNNGRLKPFFLQSDCKGVSHQKGVFGQACYLSIYEHITDLSTVVSDVF